MADSTTITHAMVLGAGMGTRMRELTADQPKPMVTVAGTPLVDHVIARLVASGVTEIVVNVHYQADVLEAHVSRYHSPTIRISDERDLLLDTGGGVSNALHLLGSDAFFIHNSDSIWIESRGSVLAAMIDAWKPEQMDTLLLLADPTHTVGYGGVGDFILLNDGRIRRRTDRDSQALVFTGVSIAHPRLFAMAPRGAFSLNRLWDQAMQAGRVCGCVMDAQWMHVGTPEAVLEADALFRAEGAS